MPDDRWTNQPGFPVIFSRKNERNAGQYPKKDQRSIDLFCKTGTDSKKDDADKKEGDSLNCSQNNSVFTDLFQ